MKTLEDFGHYFTQNIKPGLTHLEEKRLEVLKKRKICLMFFIPIAVIIIFLLTVNIKNIVLSLFVTFFLVAVIGSLLNLISKNFRIEFKQIVITSVVKFFGDKLEYYAKGHISISDFEYSNLYSLCDRFKGEDLIEGALSYSDENENEVEVNFKMSELHAEEKHEHTDSDGHRHTSYTTIFKGVFLVAEFPKTFNCDLYVFNDKGVFNKIAGKWGTKQVKLEDPVFEKEFEAYSNNQVEARYILTPEFMERLTDLKRNSKGRIKVSFRNNKIYIGISTSENILEPNYKDSINDFNNIVNYYMELSHYFGLIESLNLHRKIYL
ncbi:MAG: DUF3137 domain-containing protein [Eubacteriales bacterium]